MRGRRHGAARQQGNQVATQRINKVSKAGDHRDESRGLKSWAALQIALDSGQRFTLEAI
jgi:hypothetical protein